MIADTESSLWFKSSIESSFQRNLSSKDSDLVHIKNLIIQRAESAILTVSNVIDNNRDA